MIDLFLKGGPIMYLLLICSVVGFYLSMQKFLFLKINSVNYDLVLEKVKAQLITIGKEQTIRDLLTQRKTSLKIVSKVIKVSDMSKDDIEEQIKQSTFKEMPRLERNMSILSSIITVAPILGLLGTVLGLMDIFQVISGGGIGDSAALSLGIAEALITTVTGLGIAVPLIFVYQYLSHEIDLFIMKTDRMVSEVLLFCRSQSAIKP